MEPSKTVFCVIDQLCKKIKFSSSEEQSDSFIVRQRIHSLAQTDEVVRHMLKNKLIALQMFNHKLNRFVDIDEDDKIGDESEIHVVLINIENEVMKTVNNDSDVPNDGISGNENIVLEYYTMEDVMDTKNSTDEHGTLLSLENLVEDGKRKASDEEHASKKVKKFKTDTVLPTVKLPKLPGNLVTLYNNGKLLEKSSAFIYFWGSHLLEITSNEPTKNDIDNYAQAIVVAYPDLKGGNVPHGIVKTSLRRTMVNRKNYANATPSKVGKTKTLAVARPQRNEVSDQAFGVEDALKELKTCKHDDESNHVRRLLEVTHFYRRDYIQHKAKDVTEILANFPQLQRYVFVIEEFTQMRKLDETQLLAATEKMIGNLAIHFEMPISVETEKLAVIEELYKNLTTKKLQNVNEPLLVIEEAGHSTIEMKSSGITSPRLVTYKSHDVIASSFIIAGKNLWLKVPSPTVAKSIASLLVTYYVWQVKYPSAYTSTLTYLDHVLLDARNHKDNKVHKLIRDVDHSVKTKNQ